jgi:hypothetical protein
MRHLLVLGALLFAVSAQAVTMLPNPLVEQRELDWEPPMVVIHRLQLVAATIGIPAGGVVLEGTVGPGDLTLVFQDSFEVVTGSVLLAASTYGVSDNPSGPATIPFTGVGWIPNEEPDALADEPSTALLLAGGLVGLALRRRLSA